MNDERFPTPVLLYGLLDAGAATDDALAPDLGFGVQSQPVFVVRSSGFAVLVSAVPDRDALPPSSADAALQHKSVVDAVFARRTIVPVRYGTVADHPDELDDLLAKKAGPYRDALARLEGRAEMGVRLTLARERSHPLVPADSAYRADRPGTAYLLARQRQRDVQQGRRRRAARAYRIALAGVADQTVTSAGTVASRHRSDDRLSMAFLVPRTRTDAFRDAVARVDAPGVVDAEVAGPQAPYSFV
jgi:hypothetical protein